MPLRAWDFSYYWQWEQNDNIFKIKIGSPNMLALFCAIVVQSFYQIWRETNLPFPPFPCCCTLLTLVKIPSVVFKEMKMQFSKNSYIPLKEDSGNRLKVKHAMLSKNPFFTPDKHIPRVDNCSFPFPFKFKARDSRRWFFNLRWREWSSCPRPASLSFSEDFRGKFVESCSIR